jgi:hypothetical protein
MHLWPTYYTLEIRVYILNFPRFPFAGCYIQRDIMYILRDVMKI